MILFLWFCNIWLKICWKPLVSVFKMVLYFSVALFVPKLWKDLKWNLRSRYRSIRSSRSDAITQLFTFFHFASSFVEIRSAFIEKVYIPFSFGVYLVYTDSYWGKELDIDQFWAEVEALEEFCHFWQKHFVIVFLTLSWKNSDFFGLLRRFQPEGKIYCHSGNVFIGEH